MASPFFSGRIPQDLFDKIKQHRTETGESATEVLINALCAYVKHPIPKPSTDVSLPKVEDRFKAMEERLAALELSFNRFSLENTVIKLDNIKILDAEPNESLTSTISDNSSDNNADNSYYEPKEVFETFDNTTDNVIDNKEDETKEAVESALQPTQDLPPSATYPSFENLTASELTAVTGLTQPQIDGYKRKVTAKYQKIGQPLEEKKLLESPEKITTLKPVTVNNYPYDLFYLGQNEKGNNLWSALPHDNSCYHKLSIQSQITG